MSKNIGVAGKLFSPLLWNGGSSLWWLPNRLILHDLIFTLMLSGYPEPKTQLSHVTWWDSLNPHLLGWALWFHVLQTWSTGWQCGAISRQDKAGHFLGFSFPSCAATPRPNCFIKTKLYDEWSLRDLIFFLSNSYCCNQVLVTSYFPTTKDSLPCTNHEQCQWI